MSDATLHWLQVAAVAALSGIALWKYWVVPAIKEWIRRVVREGNDERHQAGQG